MGFEMSFDSIILVRGFSPRTYWFVSGETPNTLSNRSEILMAGIP